MVEEKSKILGFKKLRRFQTTRQVRWKKWGDPQKLQSNFLFLSPRRRKRGDTKKRLVGSKGGVAEGATGHEPHTADPLGHNEST